MSEWMAEGKVLADLIEAAGFERAEFAQCLGVSEDVLSNLCRGVTRLKGDRRRTAARCLGLSETELWQRLSGGEAPNADLRRSSTVNVRGKIVVVPQGMTPVPIYSSVPASRAGRTFSDARDVEFVPEHEADLPLWGTYVFGDSMLPEFETGDIVIFEERQALPLQAVLAVRDDEETFKILRPLPQGFELCPLNEDHDPFSAEGWTIRGVLRRRVRELRGGVRNVQEYPTTYTFRLPHSPRPSI